MNFSSEIEWMNTPNSGLTLFQNHQEEINFLIEKLKLQANYLRKII
jgi:hypothetical protein